MSKCAMGYEIGDRDEACKTCGAKGSDTCGRWVMHAGHVVKASQRLFKAIQAMALDQAKTPDIPSTVEFQTAFNEFHSALMHMPEE